MATDNYIRITDTVQLVPELTGEIKDLALSMSDPQSRRYRNEDEPSHDLSSLRVRIAATHSGKRTRNNTLYLPDRMKNSTSSWINPFGKPILLHHEKHDDAIGRIEGSSYVDTSNSFRDSADLSLLKDFASPGDELWDKFINGGLSLEDAAGVVNRLILEDKAVSSDPNYQGLGYMEIVANITSPDAIQKVLDGRYLTGSVGMTSNSATCSVCKKNWVKDGMCDHRPGKEYKGKRMTLIVGDLNGEEYSFVNRPADNHSGVLEVFQDGTMQDSFSFGESGSRVPEVSLVAVDSSVEETVEPVEEVQADPVKDFWGDEYDDIVGEDDKGRDYAAMMHNAVKDFPELEQDIRDAALSAASRKKLPNSTFCGPERSFPVNDCAHYTAALRLIGRYKGPGNKTKIRACIERKGKRLGCTSKKKEDSMDTKFNVDWFDRFESEELTQMLNGLCDTMKEREIDNPLSAEIADLKAQVDSAAEADPEMAQELRVTKQALVSVTDDLDEANTQLAERVIELRTAKIERIMDFMTLNNEISNDNEKKDAEASLSEMSVEDLDSRREVLLEAVDTMAIADRLGSGLTQDPDQTVDDPTLQDAPETNDDDVKDYSGFVATYNDLVKTNGSVVAKKYIQNLKDADRLPADFTVQGG
jgi:hypothetical protein